MILSNKMVNRISNKNVQMPFDHVHYYYTDNGNVCYLKFDPDIPEDAKKRPIILLHDLYPGFSAEEWRNTAMRLSKSRTVYAIDLPGCGRSDKPKLSYIRYLYVQLLNHFVRDITGNDVDIITSSGSIATAILADRMNPDAFNRIIAVNPPNARVFRNYPNYLHTLTRAVLRSPVLGTYLYNLKFSRIATTDRLVDKGFYDPTRLDPKLSNNIYQYAHYDYQQAKFLYAALASRYMNLDITDSLGLYSKKLYFIMGSAYPNYRSIYQSYKDYVPNSGLAVIGNTAKYPHLEDCSKFCSIIERLLG